MVMGTLVLFAVVVCCSIATKACQDRSCLCGLWYRQGYCTANTYAGLTARSNCQLTCRLCTPPNTCVDNNAQCPVWKQSGECCKNPAYMLGTCRKSCGVCRVVAQWGGWSSYQTCTKTCGRGTTYRTRACTGYGCPGKAIEYYYCNTNPCMAAASIKCGTGHVAPMSTRIVGGKKAGIWPWHVGVYTENGRAPICGGTLVSNRIVLTAAHCFSNKRFYVRVGDHDRYTIEQGEETIPVSKSFVPENWLKGKPKDLRHDIAVMILSKPVTFRSNINAACLPGPNEVFADKCTITGWGLLREKSNKQPRFLQEARVPLVNQNECQTAYRPSKIFPEQVCAGYKEGGVDSCQGDSGGPLVCKRKDGSWVLIGITSYGHGCARAGKYGVYTDTRKYLNWIKSAAAQG